MVCEHISTVLIYAARDVRLAISHAPSNVSISQPVITCAGSHAADYLARRDAAKNFDVDTSAWASVGNHAHLRNVQHARTSTHHKQKASVSFLWT